MFHGHFQHYGACSSENLTVKGSALHYETISFQMFCTCMAHPLLKTDALRLVSNEGRLNLLLLLYKWQM